MEMVQEKTCTSFESPWPSTFIQTGSDLLVKFRDFSFKICHKSVTAGGLKGLQVGTNWVHFEGVSLIVSFLIFMEVYKPFLPQQVFGCEQPF